MKKNVLFFSFLISWIMGCVASNNGDIVVRYYKENKYSIVELTKPEEVDSLVRKMICGIHDIYRLIVTEGTIQELKQSQCVEILYKNELITNLRDGKTVHLKKVLIPLSDPNDSDVVLFCGRETYSTPPYISKSREDLEKFIRICKIE